MTAAVSSKQMHVKIFDVFMSYNIGIITVILQDVRCTGVAL